MTEGFRNVSYSPIPITNEEPDEVLILDARGGLSPTQMVEQKLMALLNAGHGVSEQVNKAPSDPRRRTNGGEHTRARRGVGMWKRLRREVRPVNEMETMYYFSEDRGEIARYDTCDTENLMPHRSKAVAFDLDKASLISLRDALPLWKIEVVNGATAALLSHDWNPGAADLLVVMSRDDAAETLGLCRFLAFRGDYSTDSRNRETGSSRPRGNGDNIALRADAPLLVLVAPGGENLVGAALEAGAYSCLTIPINAKEVASMLVRARAGNQPGRHTVNLEHAQMEDRWRDDGGQG